MFAFVIDFDGEFTDDSLPTLKNYIKDNFVTADRILSVAQNGDVAAPWTLYNGSSDWAVVSNGARPISASAARQILGLDAGTADGEIMTTVISLGSGLAGSGIIFRYVSATDYCMVKYVVGTGYVVSHELNGVSTVVGSITATATVGDVLSVKFVGSALTMTVNSVVRNLVFDYNRSATIHGLASMWTSVNSPKFKEFSFLAADDF